MDVTEEILTNDVLQQRASQVNRAPVKVRPTKSTKQALTVKGNGCDEIAI